MVRRIKPKTLLVPEHVVKPKHREMYLVGTAVIKGQSESVPDAFRRLDNKEEIIVTLALKIVSGGIIGDIMPFIYEVVYPFGDSGFNTKVISHAELSDFEILRQLTKEEMLTHGSEEVRRAGIQLVG